MANTLTVKKNDTFPPLETQLTQTIEGVTSPINMAKGTAGGPVTEPAVKIIMLNGVTELLGTCELVKAAGDTVAGESGHIKYKWPKLGEKATIEGESAPKKANTMTTIAGTWQLEWQITWETGVVQSVPNEGTDSLIIVAGI